VLWVAFFESVTIGWLYGADRLRENVKQMIGYYPTHFFSYCYQYLAPGVIAVTHCLYL